MTLPIRFLCALLPALLPLNALRAGYTDDVAAWRSSREARLAAPEGWLSLIGLLWLEPGSHTIGANSDNEIVLPKGPGRLGILSLDLAAKTVRLRLDEGVEAKIGTDAERESMLSSDQSGKPTMVAFGTVSFYVIERGPRFGLRIKDTQSEGRTHFKGLDWYPVDPNWRVVAKWVRFPLPRKISITNVLGQTEEETAYGKAVFSVGGKTYELIPTQETPEAPLFFVLRDGTSGRETYGASRFLDAEAPAGDTVTLDFNKAYNPPCAFSDFATCPLPIKENILPLSITAGEKKYAGHE